MKGLPFQRPKPKPRPKTFDEIMIISYDFDQVVNEARNRLYKIGRINSDEIKIPLSIDNPTYPNVLHFNVTFFRRESKWFLGKIESFIIFDDMFLK